MIGLGISIAWWLFNKVVTLLNTDFSSSAGMTLGANCTVSGGQGVMTATATGQGFSVAGYTTVLGGVYKITYTIVGNTTGGLVSATLGGGVNGATHSAAGTYTDTLTEVVAGHTVGIIARSGPTTGTFDDLLVQKIG